MIRVGDYVTRRKYNNDILFKVEKILDNKVILSGVDLRLYADSNIDDLILRPINKKKEEIRKTKELESDSFYIPGTILHIDSDDNYIEKCSNYYKKHNIKFNTYNIEEKDQPLKIINLIKKHNPSIVVLTGHDAFYKKNNTYKNSKYYIESVKRIREYSKDIIIIAGACQSDYLSLIKNGSSFASSPKHINIHALDPSIIATNISLIDNNEVINIKEILNKTNYGPDGMGGTIIKGTMKTIYPRIK